MKSKLGKKTDLFCGYSNGMDYEANTNSRKQSFLNFSHSLWSWYMNVILKFFSNKNFHSTLSSLILMGDFLKITTLLTVLTAVCICNNSCGPSCKWTFSNNILTITGEGLMNQFSSPGDVPWYNNRGAITKVVIESGISTIGNYAFYQSSRLSFIKIPETVKKLGNYVFHRCFCLTSGMIWEITWNLNKETGNATEGEASALAKCYLF